jgi:predicted nucleic acid-binding protein
VETLSKTARISTMAECVLDANVLVAWIDAADSLHARAHDLMNQLEQDGDTEPVLLDVLVGEAVSVLCRRFRERRRSGDLAAMLADFRRRIDPSAIMWVGSEAERLYEGILDLVASTGGKLNFNDAFIAVLQKEVRIGPVATFDAGFDAVPGFVRVPFVERTRG